MRKLSVLGFGLTIFVAGCATTYDPVEVCSAEWIKPRADRAINDLESDTKKFVNSIKRNGSSFKDGKMPGPLQMIALTGAFNNFMDQLKNGQAIKDLRILKNTCNDPEIIENALDDFLEDQGFSTGLIDFIKGFEVYQNILKDEATPAS